MLEEQIAANFIGHASEIATFERWLDSSDATAPWIMFFHDAMEEAESKGGVGKTWLLRKCASLAKQRRPDLAVVTIDFFSVVDRDGVEIARRIVAGLQEVHPDWMPSTFQAALEAYQEAVSDSTDLGDIRDQLYESLASDLNNLDQRLAGNGKALLVMFDTFELIEQYPVIALLGAASTFPDTYQFSRRIGVVISGRNAPDWQSENWRGREQEVLTVPIRPFTLEEAVQFFNANCTASRPLSLEMPEARTLYERTQGRPILVGLATDVVNHRIVTVEQLITVPAANFEEYLVEQVNSLENPINWVVLFMAHIYHRFDEEMLQWLFDHLLNVQGLIAELDSRALSTKLLELSFVRSSGSGESVALHDEMRRLVNRYNWQKQERLLGDYRVTLSREIICYYEQKILDAPNERIRQTYTVEMLYHKLYVDIDEGFKFFEQRLKRAITLWQTFFARALFLEAQKFREAFSPERQLSFLLDEASLLSKEEDYEAALKIYDRVEKQADADWLARNDITLAYERASCQSRLGALNEAIENLMYVMKEENARGVETRRASALSLLGQCYSRQGDFARAVEYYEQSLEIHKKRGNRRGYADLLNVLSMIYRLQGKLDEALFHSTVSWRLRQELYSQGQCSEVSVGLSRVSMGIVYLKLGDLVNAQRCFDDTSDIYERNNYRKGIALVYSRFGQVALEKDDLDGALQWFKKSYRAALGIAIESEVNSLNKQGRVLLLQGQFEEALRQLRRAIRRARQIYDYYQLTESLIDLGSVLLRLNRQEEAEQAWQEAEALANTYNYTFLLGTIASGRGERAYTAGSYHEAFEHFGRYCYYMTLYNPTEQELAIRKTISQLLNLSPGVVGGLRQQLAAYWDTLDVGEKAAPMQRALKEVDLMSGL